MLCLDDFEYSHEAMYQEYLQKVKNHKNEALDITS